MPHSTVKSRSLREPEFNNLDIYNIEQTQEEVCMERKRNDIGVAVGFL